MKAGASTETKKRPDIWQRILGTFCGGLAGIILAVILFLIFEYCSVIAGYDRNFIRFVLWGGVIGSIAGFVFPRPLIAIGSALGHLVPGI